METLFHMIVGPASTLLTLLAYAIGTAVCRPIWWMVKNRWPAMAERITSTTTKAFGVATAVFVATYVLVNIYAIGVAVTETTPVENPFSGHTPQSAGGGAGFTFR